jgi:ketosteroid isomerase-like protein
MATEMEFNADRTTLERLNQQYVDAFMNADVDWYREQLAEDFVCIAPDGSLLDKQQFLADTIKGPDVADYKLEMVDVRIYGDAALVRATGRWTRENGSQGTSRYVDVYVKQGEKWKTVSAQITRLGIVG